MLKKFFFGFISVFFLAGVSFADNNGTDKTPSAKSETSTESSTESKPKSGYSLSDALRLSQEVEEDGALTLPSYMPGVSEDKNGKSGDITGTIQNITNGLAGIAGGVAVLFIVINAAHLVFAMGGSDDISKAKKGLTWSVLGLVLIIFAYVITKTVISLTYSGENFGDAEEVEVVKETPVEEEQQDPICETNLNKAEKSCYERLPDQDKQSRKAGACSMESSSVQSKVCESMKLSDHMTEETSCTLENIQHALKSGGFYSADDVKKGWAKADNKYGMATERAMEKYYNSRGCKDTSASSSEKEGSISEATNKNNQSLGGETNGDSGSSQDFSFSGYDASEAAKKSQEEANNSEGTKASSGNSGSIFGSDTDKTSSGDSNGDQNSGTVGNDGTTSFTSEEKVIADLRREVGQLKIQLKDRMRSFGNMCEQNKILSQCSSKQMEALKIYQKQLETTKAALINQRDYHRGIINELELLTKNKTASLGSQTETSSISTPPASNSGGSNYSSQDSLVKLKFDVKKLQETLESLQRKLIGKYKIAQLIQSNFKYNYEFRKSTELIKAEVGDDRDVLLKQRSDIDQMNSRLRQICGE